MKNKLFQIKNIYIINVVLSLIIFGLSIYRIDKVFNLYDEGYYYLVSNNPQDLYLSTTFFYLYNYLILKISNFNFYSLRITSILGSIASIATLYIGSYKYFIKKQIHKITIANHISILYMFTCFQYIFPMTFSYNTLNTYCCYIFMGVYLYVLATPNINKFTDYFYIIIGVFIGISMTVKFPTGIILLLVMLILMHINIKKFNINLLFQYCLLIVGILLPFFVISSIIPFKKLIVIFNNGLKFSAISNSGHGITQLLINLSQIIELLKNVLYYITLPLIIFFCRNKINKKVYTMLHIAIFIGTNSFFLYKYQGLTQWWYIPLIILFWMFYITLFNLPNLKYTLNLQNIILLFVLFIIPFIAAVGTNNNITSQIIITITTLGLLIIILIQQNSNEIIKAVFNLTIGIMSFITSYNILVNSPYGVPEDTKSQIYKIQLQENTLPIKVDRPTYEFISTLGYHLKKCGFKKDSNILGFYQIPGLIYALGGRSIGCSWYLDAFDTHNMNQLCFNLISREDIIDSYIIIGPNLNHLNGNPLTNPRNDLLKTKNINIDNAFETCSLIPGGSLNYKLLGSESIIIMKPKRL